MIRKLLTLALLACLPAASARAQASASASAADQNAAQARTVLESMVKAMGGDAWLKLKVQMRKGHAAGFYQGDPEGGTTLFWEFHSWPDHDRIEITKHRDVVEFYLGRAGWEVTYKGKSPMPADQLEEYLRRRDHSIETIAHTWMNNPKTVLLYEGQHMAERHLADQVTLISASNESVTILLDAQTHLPLRRSFQWRDPVYKDKNLDAEEYDDYHVVDGIATPFTITRFKNNEMVSQRFYDQTVYNQEVAADLWDVDATAKRIKK